MIIAIMGVLEILSFGLRTTTLSWNFGLVPTKIPVLYQEFDDETSSSKHNQEITANTPMIVLNDHALYFGTAAAFSTNYRDVRSKFVVPHHEGAPQVQNLLTQLAKWKPDLASQPVLLLPSPDWPAAVVIQMIHYLRESDHFSHVVLAGGYL